MKRHVILIVHQTRKVYYIWALSFQVHLVESLILQILTNSSPGDNSIELEEYFSEICCKRYTIIRNAVRFLALPGNDHPHHINYNDIHVVEITLCNLCGLFKDLGSQTEFSQINQKLCLNRPLRTKVLQMVWISTYYLQDICTLCDESAMLCCQVMYSSSLNPNT